MMRFYFSILAGLCLSSVGFAKTPIKDIYPDTKQTGLFIGLGGGYSWSQINAETSATLNSISGTPPNVIFTGSSDNFKDKSQDVFPEARLGYFGHFSTGPWLWGVQLLYQYLGAEIKTNNQNIHLKNASVATTDQIIINDAKTKVTDAFILPVFVGYSIKDSFIYLGIGPSLFKTEYDLDNVADNHSAFYIGNINQFSDTTTWMWGGAVQAGIAYYLNPTWFLNLSYLYSITGEYTTNHSATFASDVNGGLNNGNLQLKNQQRFTTQEVGISINKIF